MVKADPALNSSAFSRITNSPSLQGISLMLHWTTNNGIEISKSGIQNDGVYSIIDTFQQTSFLNVNLSGTTYSTIPNTFFRYYENRSFILRIESAIPGSPKALILMSKNLKTLHGSQTTITAPGQTTGEHLDINWEPNSLLAISKSSNGYDGSYRVEFTRFS
jgi:hypothetical protein